jgi:hypothetical protein
MLNFQKIINLFPQSVSYQVLMFKKRRQKPAAYIAVFIDGGIQHHPAIFPVPDWIIRTAPEERDTKWRSTDNHKLSFTTDALYVF